MASAERLTRRTTQEIERFLRVKHAEISQHLRNGMNERRSKAGPPSPDASVWATEVQNDAIELALLERHTAQLAQIEAALARLTRGAYGFCRECQQFIGVARLRALPFAQRCARCQGRVEGHATPQAGARRAAWMGTTVARPSAAGRDGLAPAGGSRR